MLPDGSGLDLLRELASPGAPSPGARRVAFSAGISAPMQRQLDQAGVHEVLHKPASLADLQACLGRALSAAPAAGQRPATQASAADPGAVQTYFGGDQALYDAYLAQCRPQFARDASAGDLAEAQADLQGLRRLAHSLKSVWRSLGFAQDSALAARLEGCAAHGDAAASAVLWQQLRARLLAHAGSSPESPA